MTRPVLYSFRRCPYAMRARLALDAADIPVEHREVLLRSKPRAMLDASPKGTVPVLVLTDGRTIDESLDVMLWALQQRDSDGWMTDPAADRTDADAFLADFKPALDRYKYASRYDPSAERGTVNLSYRAVAMERLLQLAEPLADQPQLRGNRPRLIDMATFPFVRQFAAVEPEWWAEAAPQPLQTWLELHLKSERFKRVMAKHPVWAEDPTEDG